VDDGTVDSREFLSPPQSIQAMMMDVTINRGKESCGGASRRVGDRLVERGSLGGRGMTMKQTIGALALLSLAALVPSVAEARGYGRSGGYVNTPFGTMSMSDMQQAGGNPFVAAEMQQERMMYQQQMMMMKQQQQYMQQMQKMQKNGQNPGGNGQMQSTQGGFNSASGSSSFGTASAKKKKKTVTSTKSSKSDTAKGTTSGTSTTTASTEKKTPSK
jgi:hypothetical protein